MLGSHANGLVVLLALVLLDQSLSLKESFPLALILMPIGLVRGYLTAVWQWQDLETKYPEDRLSANALITTAMANNSRTVVDWC